MPITIIIFRQSLQITPFILSYLTLLMTVHHMRPHDSYQYHSWHNYYNFNRFFTYKYELIF